jgi:transcriptional adapter 3
MPPAPSQKGTGKKGAGASRQRSRNTTPSSGPLSSSSSSATATAPVNGLPPVETIEIEFLELKLESIRALSFEELTESSGGANSVNPDSKAIDGLITRLSKLHEIIETRHNNCDRGMRLVAAQRKNHQEEVVAAGRRDEERGRKDGDEEEKDKKANKKKRKANESLAPQETNTGRPSLFIIHQFPPQRVAQVCLMRTAEHDGYISVDE